MKIILKIKKEDGQYTGYGHRKLSLVVSGKNIKLIDLYEEPQRWLIEGFEKDDKLHVFKLTRVSPFSTQVKINQDWSSYKND